MSIVLCESSRISYVCCLSLSVIFLLFVSVIGVSKTEPCFVLQLHMYKTTQAVTVLISAVIIEQKINNVSFNTYINTTIKFKDI